jgi:hypothetical protein
MTDWVCVNGSVPPCPNYGEPVVQDDPESPYSPVCPACGSLAGEMEQPGPVEL